MAQHLRIANNGEIPRQLGDWAETETARDIWRSLELVRASDKPSMTMIAGAPGVGKTSVVERFCDRVGGHAIYIQAARGEGTVWNFAQNLREVFFGRYFGDFAKFNTAAQARALFADRLRGSYSERCLLVVDEAQYLNQRNGKTGQVAEAFEWLRAMSDEGGFDLVFCGDLQLPQAIYEMPQLESRLLRPVVISEVSRADVECILQGTPFCSSRCIDALHSVARMRGGLRNVEKAAEVALMFAGNDPATPEHLKAAITDLKLDRKRAL